MNSLYSTPFQPVTNSTDVAFNTTSGSSGLYALESTGLREWQLPGGRTVRVASISGDDAYIRFGSSTITVGTTNGMLLLGNTVELFRITAKDTYVITKSSTDVIINFTLGVGA